MLVNAIAIGLVYGFILFESFGIVAGGLIAPGYIALSFDQPFVLALCFAVAFLTMWLVRILSFFTILYGRRRFMVCVLLAFALQWTLGAALMGTEFGQGRVAVVGYIIPGLLANEMERQGAARTLVALLLLSCLVWLTLYALNSVSV